MAAEIPEGTPASFLRGDTVKWYAEYDNYSPDDGWVLTYTFVSENSVVQLTSQITDNGDGRWLVNIPATTSAGYTHDEYKYQAYVTYSGERWCVERGRITILPNYAAASGTFDDREHVKATLDALEALIAGKPLAGDATSYAIGGRSITRLSPEELYQWRNRYAWQFEGILRREARDAGRGHGGNVEVQFP